MGLQFFVHPARSTSNDSLWSNKESFYVLVMIESSHKALLPLAFMAAILGGLLGLVVLLMLYLLSNLALGKDQKNKHGIGEEVSRFGGIAIFLGVLAYFYIELALV